MVQSSRVRLLFASFAMFACAGLLLGQFTGCAPPEPRPEPRIDAVDPDDVPEEPIEEPVAPPDEPVAEPEEPVAEPEEPFAEPAPEEPMVEPEAPVEEPEPEEPVVEPEPEEPMAEPETPAEEPAAPAEEPTDAALPADAPLSAYAPAENLVEQVDHYLARMEEAVSTPDEYKDGVTRIARDSNTMIVIALALGLHDEDNKLKANAPAMLAAAQAVAATDDYEAAKAAVENLKAAVAEGGEGPELKWEKVASLKELMEQVPLIHASIRRRVSRRFERNVDGIAGDAATVAVIAQGSIPNLDETIEPEKPDEWKKYNLEMRDAAAALGAAARAVDEEAAKAAFEKLDQSCDDCHVIFHPEEVN